MIGMPTQTPTRHKTKGPLGALRGSAGGRAAALSLIACGPVYLLALVPLATLCVSLCWLFFVALLNKRKGRTQERGGGGKKLQGRVGGDANNLLLYTLTYTLDHC